MEKFTGTTAFFKHKSSWIFPLFLFFSLGLFSSISFYNFISHSEFWAIASAKLLGSNSPEATPLYYRSLFYSTLKPLFWFPLDNVSHIKLARLLFGLISFTSFFLFLKSIRQMTNSTQTSLLFGLFLLSFQIYFYNIFRIRSDVLAMFFIVIAYNLINSSFLKQNSQKINPSTFLLCLLAFSSTPKSIYLIFMILAYEMYLKTNKGNLKKNLLHILTYVLAPISLFITIGAIAIHWKLIDGNPYALALNYYYKSFHVIFTLNSWQHLLISFQLNPLHYLYILLGIVYLYKNKTLWTKKIFRAQGLLFTLSLLILIIHPEKWTYFIAPLIPFISLPVFFIFLKQKKVVSQLLILLSFLGSPLVTTTYHSWFHSNKDQIKIIKQLETVYQQIPQATYFDSTGLLPRENSVLHFLGPNDSSTRMYTLNSLHNDPPDFIFYTAKLRIANPEILIFLYKNYTEIATDTWVKNSKLKLININDLEDIPLQVIISFDYFPILRHPLSF